MEYRFSGFPITWIRVRLFQELYRNLHSFHFAFTYHSTCTFQKEIVLKKFIRRCQSSRVQIRNQRLAELLEYRRHYSLHPKIKEGRKDDSSDDNEDNSTVTPNTPKMNLLFSNISNSKTKYYGCLELLDKQAEFDEVFGKNPVLLPTNPTSVDSSTTVKLLLDFIELCRLDVFLHACLKFYLGSSNIDKNTSAHEVCREISNLRQE